nr:DUF4874 domain-containing protein [Zooshikella ganghwensis]
MSHTVIKLLINFSILIFFNISSSLSQAVIYKYKSNSNLNTVLLNPERGFRGEVMINVKTLLSPWSNNNQVELLPKIFEEIKSNGGTVIQNYFYLSDYWDKPLPPIALKNMQKVIDIYRRHGMKMLLRFAYDTEHQKYRYTTSNMLQHIRNMKDLWLRNQDIIYAFQSGFIGLWGEWHSSLYKHERYPETTELIMTTLFKNIPPGMMVTFRQPQHKNQSNLGDYYWRAGFHNDFFTLDQHPSAKDNDYVWGTNAWSQVDQEGLRTIVDGEMPYQGNTSWNLNFVIDGFKSLERFYRHKYSTFSYTHNTNLNISAWKNERVSANKIKESGLRYDPEYFAQSDRSSYELMRDFFGYRLSLEQAVIPKNITLNDSFVIKLKLSNFGMAGPINSRYLYLTLVDLNEQRMVCQSTPFKKNATALEPGKHELFEVINFSCNEELIGKEYAIGLWLPDKHPTIKQDARYSIRLANDSSVPWFAPKGHWGINILEKVKLN